VTVFAVLPGTDAGAVGDAAWRGALFGLVARDLRPDRRGNAARLAEHR